MHCPRCDVEVLDERERDGVTIDVCPKCRGVWLDRGELERLIARAESSGRSRDERASFDDRHRGDDRRFDRRRERDDDDDDDDDDRHNRGRGFFGSLRDFFD